MDALPSALTVLSAMITPAVLLSACSSLILSTSSRLGRVVDRVRDLSDRFEQLAQEDLKEKFAEEKRAMIFHQMDRLTSRARLLQRSLTAFYLAVGIFVATSVAIGIVSIISEQYGWIPVVLGLVGSCFLFYGSILQIFEARFALESTYREMDFLWSMGQSYAPSELLEKRKPKRKRMPWE
jgi:ABC-type multidrug transport system fused ATPase/permease subunit